MIFNDISGLHMRFLKWPGFCRDGWKKRYKYFQVDKDEDVADMYSIKNVSGFEIAAVPEITAF